MDTDITSLAQFKKMLAQRKGQPLVIVERSGWREMGHEGDIYIPGTILSSNKKELVVERDGQPSYLTFPPSGEVKFRNGERMEHWGKDKHKNDVVLLAYEWPDEIDVKRAERCQQAFVKTAAAFETSVAKSIEARKKTLEPDLLESRIAKEAEEAHAGQWIGEHSQNLRKRAETLAPAGEALFLIHQATKDNQEHHLFVLCDAARSLYLVDAKQGPQEVGGKKVWEATEWPLSPQSLRFRMHDLPGLAKRVENPRNDQPQYFNLPDMAEHEPEGFGRLPKAMTQRARATSAAPHELIDVKVTKTKGKPAMVEVTHKSAFMAGPQTVKFVPDRQLAGGGEAQMLAVIEAAKSRGALEFRGGRLCITKEVETGHLKAQPGAFPLVAESATSASITH
jgi:hypothetical protein